MKPSFSKILFIPFILLLFISNATAQNYELKRIEPLNWWVDMHNPRLQILLYGENIGQFIPQVDYKGVEIVRTVRVENDNYLFVYLHISPQTEPGTMQITLLKNGDDIITYPYELKKREEGSELREGFNSSDVIYLITPDRFANGNLKNDSVSGYADKLNRNDHYGRHGGNIQGIIDHLDYIEEMGFTAIWLNPVLENEMLEASYHGYATTDYYKVDPRFGSNKLYQKLSREADERGIKLIMDMITNHTGSNHWWVKDPPASDWYHYQGDYKITNHRRVTLHDPYAAKIDKKRFTHGWFVKVMPDMNQSNELLADYLIYNSIWWIEYAGLEGVRADTYAYNGAAFTAKWSCRIIQEYPNFNIVGEEWSVNPATVAKWQRGSDLVDGFKSCLPSLMDFPLHTAMIMALTQKETWGTGWVKAYQMLSYDFLYPNPYNLVIFADNHDMDRFFRQVKHDFDLYKMGMAYILTMRGIPQIYYGTEILMSNEDSNNHGQIRSDFPGGWPGDTVNAFTGEGLTDLQSKAQNFLRELLNWRKQTPVIHTGKLMQYAPKQNGIYVYFRYNDAKTVMVIFNKSEEAVRLNSDFYYERLDGFIIGTDVITEKMYELDDLMVPTRSVLILELE